MFTDIKSDEVPAATILVGERFHRIFIINDVLLFVNVFLSERGTTQWNANIRFYITLTVF